jgi:hypothetical protein
VFCRRSGGLAGLATLLSQALSPSR